MKFEELFDEPHMRTVMLPTTAPIEDRSTSYFWPVPSM